MAINHAALSHVARVAMISAELNDVALELADFLERMARTKDDTSALSLLEQANYASGRFDGLKFALEVFSE